MRQFLALSCLCLPSLLSAQLFTLPPNASADGVVTKSAGTNGSAKYWGSSSSLGAYRIAGDGYQNPIHPGSTDNELGLTWNFSMPASLTVAREDMNVTGGTVRAIFVGETAGWANDFGYSYTGIPSGSGAFTAWKKIQSIGAGTNIRFGDYFDVSLDPGQAADFDFWFSANDTACRHQTSLTTQGGVYTFFDPENSSTSTHQLVWAQNSILVNTWIPSLSASVPVTTYLVGIEDWRMDRCGDGDYNDLIVAFQFLGADGSPIAAVPEPKTWALVAGMLTLGFVLTARFRPGQAC